jgi:spoIIIJ-associated protein
MGIETTIQIRRAQAAEEEGDPPWILDIQGRDLGVLIGRHGETLDALQYITRLIVSRELQSRANVVVDVEGYKSRRETSLRKLALNMAAQARQMGRTMTLEPMPPNERRIIHIALRDDNTVRTESVGMGEHRRVTIIPNKPR